MNTSSGASTHESSGPLDFLDPKTGNGSDPSDLKHWTDIADNKSKTGGSDTSTPSPTIIPDEDRGQDGQWLFTPDERIGMAHAIAFLIGNAHKNDESGDQAIIDLYNKFKSELDAEDAAHARAAAANALMTGLIYKNCATQIKKRRKQAAAQHKTLPKSATVPKCVAKTIQNLGPRFGIMTNAIAEDTNALKMLQAQVLAP